MADLPLLRALTTWMGRAHGSMQSEVEQHAALPGVQDSGVQPAPSALAASMTRDADGARRLERLPSPLRRLLADAATDSAISAAALRLLLQMALLADTPELAVHPAWLDARVEMVLQVLQKAVRTRVPPRDLLAEDASPVRQPPARGTGVPSSPTARKVLAGPATEPARGDRSAPEPEALPLLKERGSAAAGAWLLVRPLARMGIAAWLERRPTLAAAGFARALLRHIVERMRIEADDPVFAFLDLAVEDFDPDLLAAWRIGLDRWLRRSVHRTLAGIVRRRGWLRAHASGLEVRFNLAQADIALRLKALDTDPGWVPWLGQQIAYHYRDEALR